MSERLLNDGDIVTRATGALRRLTLNRPRALNALTLGMVETMTGFLRRWESDPAVGTVLIAYNWPKTNVDRYRRVQRFVEAFFPRIGDFQRPPHHPKWRDVNIAAVLPGWTRFEAAQAWLDSHLQAAPRSSGAPAAAAVTAGPAARPPLTPTGVASGADQQMDVDPALYQEFLKWRQLRR